MTFDQHRAFSVLALCAAVLLLTVRRRPARERVLAASLLLVEVGFLIWAMWAGEPANTAIWLSETIVVLAFLSALALTFVAARALGDDRGVVGRAKGTTNCLTTVAWVLNRLIGPVFTASWSGETRPGATGRRAHHSRTREFSQIGSSGAGPGQRRTSVSSGCPHQPGDPGDHRASRRRYLCSCVCTLWIHFPKSQ